MMLFYQTRSHFHKTVDLPNTTCSHCNNRGTLKMYLMQHYTWMFGPIIPGNKYALIQCDVCETKMPNTLWTKELDAIYKQEKKALKTPFRMWRGMIFMSLLFIIPYSLTKLNIIKKAPTKPLITTVNAVKLDTKNFIEGDVLFISIDKTNKEYASLYDFTLVKIIKIEGDKTILKKYTELFDFKDQNSLRLSDVTNAKFEEILEVKTDFLRKNESLIYYKTPIGKQENRAFGHTLSILK